MLASTLSDPRLINGLAANKRRSLSACANVSTGTGLDPRPPSWSSCQLDMRSEASRASRPGTRRAVSRGGGAKGEGPIGGRIWKVMSSAPIHPGEEPFPQNLPVDPSAAAFTPTPPHPRNVSGTPGMVRMIRVWRRPGDRGEI